MTKKRLAISHPALRSGGSEVTALWLLESLSRDFAVTLLTGGPVEWDRLNELCGTAVRPDLVTVMEAPIPRLVANVAWGDALRGAYFGRFVHGVSQGFDLCISAYNFGDFAARSIHFIADFSWDDQTRLEFDPASAGTRGVMQTSGLPRRAYLALADVIRGRRQSPPRDHDIVVANSQWSADLLSRRFGVEAGVIYPPVPAPVGGKASRQANVVMLGRVSPEKRVLEGMGVVEDVRKRGHEVELHIIGRVDETAYGRLVRARAKEHGDWVKLRGGLYGGAKFEALACHTFGLHMRSREAFGIAVAEMVRMGIVPIVPSNSAPAEIVADDRLVFDRPGGAVEIIDRLLRDQAELDEIQRGLESRAAVFSTDRFVSETQELARLALKGDAPAMTSRSRVRRLGVKGTVAT